MQSLILKEDHQVSCFPRVLLFRKVSLLTPTEGSGAGAEEGLVQERGREDREGGEEDPPVRAQI